MDNTAWSCEIGPIDRAKIPNGGDLPMRQAVQKAYFELTGEHAEVTSSGWGKAEQTNKES
jgi:hypothetical protein